MTETTEGALIALPPSHAVSWLLAKVLGRLGAQLPFEQAARNLKEDYGIRLSKHTLEQICEEAGQVVLDQEDAQRQRLQQLPSQEQPSALPDSPISPQKAYVFADGAMMHAEGAWQEIRVASVAAENAQDEVVKVEHRARFLNCTDFGWQLLLLARRAGYHRATASSSRAMPRRWASKANSPAPPRFSSSTIPTCRPAWPCPATTTTTRVRPLPAGTSPSDASQSQA